MAGSLLALALWVSGVLAQQPIATSRPAPVISVGTSRLLTTPAHAIPRVDSNVRPAQYRPPGGQLRVDSITQDFDIRFDLPGPELLFRLDSEAAMQQRMKQERRKYKKDELTFPEEPFLARDAYHGRDWPRMSMEVEPHYVCHKRLLFEEPNAERFGWEVGLFQPLISTAHFVKDTALLPMHLATYPTRWYDCSAGKCLPGDPVPYLCYPPEVTVTGLTAEAIVIAGLMAIFP